MTMLTDTMGQISKQIYETDTRAHQVWTASETVRQEVETGNDSMNALLSAMDNINNNMAANSLISANRNRIPKNLVSMQEAGPKVRCYHGKSSADEATWIAEQVLHLQEQGTALRDICVLYRAHYASRPVEEALVKAQIPYAIYSGVQFFDRKEVKDALAYLRMVIFRDDLSFERIANVPKRNLGQRRMKFLRQYAEGNGVSLFQALCDNLDNAIMKGTKAREFVDLVQRYTAAAESRPASELLSDLLDKSGYEQMLRTEGSQERLDNLAELRQAVYEFETTCGEEATPDNFLAHVSMMTNLDKGLSSNKVKLMTVHAAKGLEFPYVFICSMNEGVIPSRKTQTTEAMEEERRLAFVAMTRAEKALFLTCADGTGHDGMPRYPSRFVLDIDPDLVDFETPLEDSLVKDARAYMRARDRQLDQAQAGPAFAVGDRISHMVFGPGTIVGIDADRSAYLVQFDGMETPRSLSYNAKLEARQ